MATTFVDYTGDGNATKSFSFPSYKVEDIKVDVDGVIKTVSTHYNITSYTTTGGGNVVFIDNSGSGGTNHIPASPAAIRIFRDTDVDTAKATYTAGSSVKADDLNNNMTQLLYAAQEEQTQTILSSDIKDGTIRTVDIGADQITSALIADDQINSEHYVDGSIDTAHIADSQITSAKIADGTIVAGDLASNAVTTAKIADANVTTAKINNSAVTTAKIADSTGSTDGVTSAKIASSAVTTTKIQDASVTTAKIANSQVTTAKILDDAVTTAKIADNQITTAKIADDAITTGKIAALQVTNSKLSANSVDSVNYVDGSIDTVHIGDDQVTTGKLGTNSVTTLKITDANVTTPKIADGAVTTDKLGNDAVTTGKIGANQVTTAKIADSNITTAKIANANITTDKIADEAVTMSKIADSTIVTNSEQASHTGNDTTFYTTAAAEAAFLRQDSSENIASGVTWSSSDAFVATTAAIDARIIELVDDVGGFVPIANETSFPTSNPDINNPATGGTIVSVKAASTNLAPSGTTVTIANGRGSGLAVVITGVTATIPSGFGFLVETTSTDHTYAFHRLVPKATEVTTVAGSISNVNIAATNVADINNFADVYQISNNAPTARADTSSLQVGDLWFDSSSNKVLMIYDGSSGDGFSAATPNQSDLVNINIVAGQITFQEDLGLITNAVNTGSGNNSVNTVATDITNVNTVAGSISNVNAVAGNATNINNVAADASDIGAVAGKATEIGRLGTVAAVADLAILGTNAIVSDMDTLADISSNITTVAGVSSNVTTVAGSITNVNTTAGSIANVNTTASNISNVNTVAGISSNVTTVAGIQANVTTVANNNSNVTTVAGSISNVNNFKDLYQIASSNPSTDGSGNALAAGDLYFNTSQNELRIYTGSAWQGGVTATGSLAGLSANTFSDNQTINGNIIVSGTVDGRDVAADGTKLDGIEASATADQTASEIVALISGQTIAPNVITTTNLTLDFGSIA